MEIAACENRNDLEGAAGPLRFHEDGLYGYTRPEDPSER
jgi:hypothetical protein